MGVQPVVPLSDRSMMKPVSLFELSFHVRLIWMLPSCAVATRLLGAVGAAAAAALAILELADAPSPVLTARTR